MTDLIGALRLARRSLGVSQARVAHALEISPQLLSQWERSVGMPDLIRVVQWGAAVGLDVRLNAYPGGSPLRDAGQLRILARARRLIGERWTWRTEVPVSRNPLDRRAMDAVIARNGSRVGLEVISRLLDAQAQVRAATLKQADARLDCMVLVLGRSRHNHEALGAGGPTIHPAFPARPRSILRALRAGDVPAANGVILV